MWRLEWLRPLTDEHGGCLGKTVHDVELAGAAAAGLGSVQGLAQELAPETLQQAEEQDRSRIRQDFARE